MTECPNPKFPTAQRSASNILHDDESCSAGSHQTGSQTCCSPSHLPPLHKQSAEEAPSPRFVVGPGGNVLSVSEDEISSIISRALTISEDRRHLLDSIVESHASDTTSMLSESSSSASSSSWSSESSDSEAGFLSDELYNYDSSLLSSSLHPEISVNGKANLKGKYSVMSTRMLSTDHSHTP